VPAINDLKDSFVDKFNSLMIFGCFLVLDSVALFNALFRKSAFSLLILLNLTLHRNKSFPRANNISGLQEEKMKVYKKVAKISRILVAVDGSDNADRAFEYAAYLAKQCEAERLFIINVIEGFARNIDTWRKHDSIVKELEENSRELLERYKSRGAITSLCNTRNHKCSRQCWRRNSKISRQGKNGRDSNGQEGP